MTALVGPSGCGKTTLLRAINRLHDHTGGRVGGSIRIGDLDTHNMFRAARVANHAAVFLLGDDRGGELVETGPTAEVFMSPFDPRITAHVEGRVG